MSLSFPGISQARAGGIALSCFLATAPFAEGLPSPLATIYPEVKLWLVVRGRWVPLNDRCLRASWALCRVVHALPNIQPALLYDPKLSTGRTVQVGPCEDTLSSSSRRHMGYQAQQHGLCDPPAVLVWFRPYRKPFPSVSCCVEKGTCA